MSLTNPSNISCGSLNDNLQDGRAIIIFSQVWERPQYRTDRCANFDVEPIPITVVQSILRRIQKTDKSCHLQLHTVAGAYKVRSGPDAGKVRDLPSIMVSLKTCSPVQDIWALASNIATIANQESVILCVDKVALDDGNAAATVAEIMLSPSRDMTFDRELWRQIAAKYGGASKIDDHRIFVVVNFSGGDLFKAGLEDAASYFYDLVGVTSVNLGCMNVSFPRGRKTITRAQNFAAVIGRIEELGSEIKRRLKITFAVTWELLLSNEFRPPYRHYLIIDQRIFTSKLKQAPMHWSVRVVKLDENRIEIKSLWSSELVLNDRVDGGLEADPLIDRGKTSSGTLLIKNVNWESTLTRTLGSYVIPVEDAEIAIAAMKSMSRASGRWPSKYHTEDPNCLSYALWLLVKAKPIDNKPKRKIDVMVRDVYPRPVRPLQEQGPITALLHIGYPTTICFLLSILETYSLKNADASEEDYLRFNEGLRHQLPGPGKLDDLRAGMSVRPFRKTRKLKEAPF